MAYRVFHRPLIAGVALAGASAITFATVPALPTEKIAATAPLAVRTEMHDVALTGFADVLTSVVTAIQESGDALVNTSPALYWQVHEQWPDPELLSWNYALFTDIFLAPLAPLVVGPVNDAVAEAVAEVFPGQAELILRVPELIEYAVVRLVGPLLSAIGAAGAAHEQIYYSTTTYEITPFIEAIIAAPGYVIDGFFNGGYGDLRPLLTGEVGGEPIPAPGLLTPWGAEPVQRFADNNAELVDSGAEPEPVVEDTGAQLPSTTVEDTTARTTAAADAVAQPVITTGTAASQRVAEAGNDDAADTRTGIRESLRDLRASARQGISRSTETSGAAESSASSASSRDDAASTSRSGVERGSAGDDAA